MSFGQRLRELRRDLDLSQGELAERASCSVNTIRELEADERRPSRDLAERLSETFAFTPRERADFLRLARGRSPLVRPALPVPLTTGELYLDSLAAFDGLGYRRGVAESIEGLAAVAGVQGRALQAARLFGLAEAIREAVGAPLLPADRSRYAPTLAAAREQLE